ncbi:hypothetical protein KP509_35G006600 [Ceratopteris richardii]|uniref:EF-hand domain-containing protein n=1 Tax=Ceratopteris richardii TaxID=49495 RepID=A0A8T2QEH1_CERRI|nr:hypothetical protein KP509_35G006600 [Ceratopteris richardii]
MMKLLHCISCCLPIEIAVEIHEEKEGDAQCLDDERNTEKLRDLFQSFDIDGDGRISLEELHAVLNSLGIHVSKEESDSILSRIDTDNNGHIDFEEFKSFLKAMKTECSVEEEDADMAAAFAVYDIDGDGKIDAHELLEVLTKMSNTLPSMKSSGITLQDCVRMIAQHDCNADGKIDFHEFKAMVK